MQQQFVAATVYYAYFFVATAIMDVLSLIIGVTLVTSLFGTPDSSFYIITKFCIMPFINTIGIAQHSFWKVENRHALIMANESVMFSIRFATSMFLYCIKGDTTLDSLAIAEIVAGAVQCVWSFFVLMRKPFLGVKYKGVMKLTLKRLSPFRPKFLITVLLQSLPIMAINISDAVVYLTCIVRAKTRGLWIDQYQTKILLLFDMWLVHNLLISFHKAFADVFDVFSNYNLNAKKFTRVLKSIKSTLIFDFLVGVVISVLLAYGATVFLNILMPTYIPGLVDV